MNSISALLKSTDSFHPLYCSMSQQHMALVTLPLPQTGCLSDTASSPWPPSPGQVLLSPLQAHSSIWSWGSGGLGLSQVLLLSWWWWFSCQVVSDSCDPMDWSPPGSSVPGILQARILEWVAISSSTCFLTLLLLGEALHSLPILQKL